MNEAVIHDFYNAFRRKDWKAMQECYHPEAVFSDPVFTRLSGKEVHAMWHMLVTAGKDLSIEFNNVQATNSHGSADWEAHYSFSKTGKKVHNIIHARFDFKDGRIILHQDSFNLWKWTRMALGIPGLFLGWSPLIQKKVRETASRSLRKFMNDHVEYQGS